MARPRFRLLRIAWRLLVLALLIFGWIVAALALHVVIVPAAPEGSRAGEEFKVLVLPKNRLSFRDTYADTRNWTAEDARGHDALLSRLIEAGHGDRLGHVLDQSVQHRLEEMLNDRRGLVAGENRR